ncbi:DUF2637 domain-containing protein [Streptomyces sp. NPDC053474]|uniref:DUF2637 domain-containing protein n=1 Tax=Streptomyces sp. NPDC053474 TaxID=3365704 RepID=UPI0037D8D136
MNEFPEAGEETACKQSLSTDTWIRPTCALVVAGVAAYASYVHQRAFSLQGGADVVSASLWPLSVDGLLLLATAGLLRPSTTVTRRARSAVWSAFMLGIAVSLAANIAAAPALEWQPVLVAGWPPVALLLAVELLVHRPSAPIDGSAAPGEERLHRRRANGRGRGSAAGEGAGAGCPTSGGASASCFRRDPAQGTTRRRGSFQALGRSGAVASERRRTS